MVTNRPVTIPRVIGHRGAAARAPENTLAGFRKAAALGCAWVEFDIRLSGDAYPVVFHDDTLDRTTDGAGAIGATPLSELLKLDAGGEPIPTLGRTLIELKSLGLGGNLELKAEAGREEVLADAVGRAIRRGGAMPSLLVTSFSDVALAAFARHAPAIPRGVLMERLTPDWPGLAARLGAVALVCNHENLRFGDARAVKEAGLSLLTYTVNDPARALELFAWGVDSVISDAPDAILAALKNN